MNRFRSFRLGLFLACLFSAPSLAWLLTSSPALADVTVHLRDEAPLVGAVAAWRPYEQILVVFQDGTDRLVSAHRVLRVVDERGADRTRFLIYGRGFVGEYPEAYRGSRAARPSQPHSFLAFAGTAAGVALLVCLAIGIAIASQGGS